MKGSFIFLILFLLWLLLGGPLPPPRFKILLLDLIYCCHRELQLSTEVYVTVQGQSIYIILYHTTLGPKSTLRNCFMMSVPICLHLSNYLVGMKGSVSLEMIPSN